MRLVSPNSTDSSPPSSRRNNFPHADLGPSAPCEKSRIADLGTFTVIVRRRGSGGMNLGQFTSRPDAWPVGGGPAEASGNGHSRRTSNRYCTLDARILRTASHWEVWIFRCGQRMRCAGAIGLTLASDALRQGQNLVDDLLNDALKQLERNSHLPVWASVGRSSARRRHAGPIPLGPSHNQSLDCGPGRGRKKASPLLSVR